MSDRRTFLGNAAAAAIIAKISPLRSFGFTSVGPETIHPPISDREKAGLRGPVKQYTQYIEETIISDIQDRPEIRFSQMTEYDPDGRILSTSRGSNWVTTNTYDDNGRLTKTTSGNATETVTETLYAYDEAGHLLTTRRMNPGSSDWVSTRSYDEAGHLSKIISGKAGELPSETLYAYDEKERVAEVRNVKAGELPNRKGVVVAMDFSGDPPEGALHDDFGQWTEKRLLDDQGRLRAKLLRKYDANDRIIQESVSLENPVLLFVDKMASERGIKLDEKQQEALNEGLKSMIGGRKGLGVWYSYDSQGRIAEVCRRNIAFEAITKVSYNEHGDKSEARVTVGPNNALPAGGAYSFQENGTFGPTRPVPDEPPAPMFEWPSYLHTYEYRGYDEHGNWTEMTKVQKTGPEEHVTNSRRALTYH